MNNLLEFPAPNNKKELFERLRKILKLGWQEMPADTKRYNGSGGAGCYLEDLLGLKVGNQDIADVAGWEVKLYTPKKQPYYLIPQRTRFKSYSTLHGQPFWNYR
jgi:hypothetical protein